MKKVILGARLLLSTLGCSNDDEECNCGRVLSDRVSDYSVVIRNSCSGNEQRFYLQPGDWMNAYVGSDYCITNTTSWKHKQK